MAWVKTEKISNLNSLSDVNINSITLTNGDSIIYDSTSGKWINGNIAPQYTEVTGTLIAGQTDVTLNSAAITTSSTIDIYVDDTFFGVSPVGMTKTTGSLTLTFEEQSSNMPVKVRVS